MFDTRSTTIHTARDAITLWLDAGGRPERLVWGGQRWRVNDNPTPLEDALLHPLITHPPRASRPGWRFQAVSESDEVRVFDVREVDGEWVVLRTYD